MKGDRIKQRIYASGTWEACTALHLGGDSNDLDQNVDMALLRSADGKYYIPGASIAGAARSYLRRYGAPLSAVSCLFGAHHDRTGQQRAYASLLSVEDAPLVKGSAQPAAAVRDGVRIDAATGIAVPKFKYNLELLPPGTRFDFRIGLVLYDELPGAKEEDVLGLFQAMLEAFKNCGVRLGARTRKGLGEGRVTNWTIRRLYLDKTHPEHVAGWLARDEAAGETVDLNDLGSKPDLKGPALQIKAKLKVKTSLLIRAAGDEPQSPDMTHLRERGKPLVSGSSLGGVLRARCERIAHTVLSETAANDRMLRMFGSTPDKDGKSKRAGQVWISERELKGGDLAVQGRVQIDRFTGGARDTALFDQAPFWPKADDEHNLMIDITLECGRTGDMGLLLLAFRDLWLGDLPVGGESGVGRGVFEGVWANIRIDSEEAELTAISGNPLRVNVSGPLAAKLDALIAAVKEDQRELQA